MLSEDIEALDIYWWVTYDKNFRDCSVEIAALILNNDYEQNGKLLRWNKSLPKVKWGC